MVCSDFEISQSFIVENSKQSINFNIGCITNVTLQEVASNCGIFKQALKNSHNEFRSTEVWQGMAYCFYRKCSEIKQTVTIERLVEWGRNFLSIKVFMRDFYDSLNQIDSIFNSKVILPNNRKN